MGIDDYSDEAGSSQNSTNSNMRRPAEKSAQTRNLRDRHGSTITTVNDLEKLSINVQYVYTTTGVHSNKQTATENMTNSQNHQKDNFEVLVEKYVTEKTPLQVTPGRVSTTRSIFETTTTTSATSGGTCN